MNTYQKKLKALAKARAMKKVYAKAGMGLAKRAIRMRRQVGRGARKVRRMVRYRRGGFINPASLFAGLSSAHKQLQEWKPISKLMEYGTAQGYSAPNNKFGNALRGIGNFLTGTLGYGGGRRVKYVSIRMPRRMIRY